jgi:hypothetical protein
MKAMRERQKMLLARQGLPYGIAANCNSGGAARMAARALRNP